MNETILFWLIFFVLNSYFFVPRYLLELFHSSFFPIKELSIGPVSLRLRHVLVRPNYDIFRICTDLFVLILIYVVLLDNFVQPFIYSILLTCYFGCALIYQVYFHAFHKIYHLDPVFFHDLLMLKTAGQIFIHEFGRKNLVMVLGAVLVGISAAILIYVLIILAPLVIFGPVSWIFIGLCLAGMLFSLLKYDYSKYPQLTFQSPMQSLIRNLVISYRSKKSVAALTLEYMTHYNMDKDVRLTVRPNVYFIIVESYGQMATSEPGLREQWEGYIEELWAELQKSGWHAASAYALAPVTGGASWISYTSMLYGLNVRNQGVYTTMLKNKYMAQYDSLFHWLKRQGYVTFRISSLGGYEKMEIPYESYSRLYGIDHWIRYPDLHYKGPHYGFGPSPPDQYALWCGDEIAGQMSVDQPRATFFITQNSHTPYESPLQVVKDWRSLNDGSYKVDKPSAFWSRPKFEKYGDAIEYQLRFLADFIRRRGASGDLFILAGDHQPPSLSKHLDNFNTPVHVISRDRNFIDLWSEYGFDQGLKPRSGEAVVRHESFHWALLRTMIRAWSAPGSRLPDFLEKGIPY